MKEYPEHEKLKKVAHLSQSCHDFIEWLQEEKGISLRELAPDGEFYYPITPSNKLLAEFYNIDLNVIEKEKCEMLDEMRKVNETSNSS